MDKLEITADVSLACDSSDHWVLSVRDNSAASQIFELVFTAEQFALALSSRYMTNIPLHISNLDRIGKQQELKRETVPKFTGDRKDVEAMAKHLAEFMVDGWMPDYSDLTNHHRMSADGVSVGFRRWV